jgi:hypothetical protein
MSVKVSDLTVDELQSMLRQMVREAVREAIKDMNAPETTSKPTRAPLDIPVLDVGPWPPGLELISREEMYGDDGR